MNETAFIDSPMFTWVVLPFLIFLARACDVSIGTVRILLLSRGNRLLAPILGFFEMLIWLLAIRQIFLNLTNVACYVAFATGFAMGNYVGVLLEGKLAVGIEVIRVITKQDGVPLIDFLKSKGYGVTSVDAQGTTGKVNIIYTIVNRRDHQDVINIIRRFNPKAFFSVEDIKTVSEGVFPLKDASRFKTLLGRKKEK